METEFKIRRNKATNQGSRCVVPFCSNRQGTDKEQGIRRSYYRFPSGEKNADLRRIWESKIRREGWTASASDRICSDHFQGGVRTHKKGSLGYIPTKFKWTGQTKKRQTMTSTSASPVIPLPFCKDSWTPKEESPKKVNKKTVEQRRQREETKLRMAREQTELVWRETGHDYVKTCTQKPSIHDAEMRLLYKRIEELEEENRQLKTKVFSLDILKENDEEFQQFTNFPNYDAPQLHDCKEEEVLTVQQLCSHERNSSVDQEEQDDAQVKDEEALCSSQEEDFGLKQESDTVIVTPTEEDNDKSESEPNREQLLSHNSPDTDSQDQGAGKTEKPGSSKHEEPNTKRLHRKRSDRNNVDNSSMSENQCDTATDETSVKCSVNDKDCKNESQKKKHHTVNSGVCNTCGKRFSQKRYLPVHERIHTGVKPFSCEMCGHSFTTCSNLKSHVRIHTGEKPFCCETCGQRFNEHRKLKQHMRTHTGEKPFSCETCGQRFINPSNLKRHMRIHTGEKPFSCETCGQRFNEHGKLKGHMRIHTGEKPFSCKTCGQRFTDPSNLKRHMRIHTGESFGRLVCKRLWPQQSRKRKNNKISRPQK
ncbi:uncharacterized protein KZ484_018296 isoform 2-T2 [Pholidichthys leucotaenia]